MPNELEPNSWKGALAGLAAGLIASFVMDRFQAALGALQTEQDDSIPATEQAANRLATIMTGEPVPPANRPAAGQAVHYALGAALGLGYGLAAEQASGVTMGAGTLFGLGVAGVLDEVGVPAAGLGPTPWETPSATHAYTLASHLVFGVVTEVSRRVVRTALH